MSETVANALIDNILSDIQLAIKSGLPPEQVVNVLMCSAITTVRLMADGNEQTVKSSAAVMHEMIDTLLEQGPVVVVQSSSDALN